MAVSPTDSHVENHDQIQMPLTAMVTELVRKQNWSDEPTVDMADASSSLATRILSDGHSYRLHIETNERSRTVSFYLYTSFNIPADRVAEVARLFNHINRKLLLGRVCCVDDGESNPVQYAVTFDFTDSKISLAQLEVMLDASFWTLQNYNKAIAAVAFADLNAQESWAAQMAREQQRDAS